MKIAKLKPGTILVWKKHSMLKRIWHTMIGKELIYNRFTIIPEETELYFRQIGKNVHIYEPIRKYSKSEENKLAVLMGDKITYEDWLEVTDIINLVRPNTFCGHIALNECRYYKKVNIDEKSDKYLY